MRVCPVIGWLSRAANKIGDAEAAALAEALKGLVNLKELYLDSKQLLFVCAQYLKTPPIFTTPHQQNVLFCLVFFLSEVNPPPRPFLNRTILIPPTQYLPHFPHYSAHLYPHLTIPLNLNARLPCHRMVVACRQQDRRRWSGGFGGGPQRA